MRHLEISHLEGKRTVLYYIFVCAKSNFPILKKAWNEALLHIV